MVVRYAPVPPVHLTAVVRLMIADLKAYGIVRIIRDLLALVFGVPLYMSLVTSVSLFVLRNDPPENYGVFLDFMRTAGFRWCRTGLSLIGLAGVWDAGLLYLDAMLTGDPTGLVLVPALSKFMPMAFLSGIPALGMEYVCLATLLLLVGLVSDRVWQLPS